MQPAIDYSHLVIKQIFLLIQGSSPYTAQIVYEFDTRRRRKR